MLFWSECDIFNLKPLISQSSDDSKQEVISLEFASPTWTWTVQIILLRIFQTTFYSPWRYKKSGCHCNLMLISCSLFWNEVHTYNVHVWQLVSHWTESCLFLGKILNDDQPLTEYNIEEKGFVVVMVTKVKNPLDSFKLVQQNCAWGWGATFMKLHVHIKAWTSHVIRNLTWKHMRNVNKRAFCQMFKVVPMHFHFFPH